MKKITLEATLENIEKVISFVYEQLEVFNCSKKAQMQIAIAIDELLSNIAHYAYEQNNGTVTVCIEVEEDPLAVIITFIDNGIPFDPLAKVDPDVKLSVDEREIGGLGIYIVKKSMDEITYEYQNGQNILKIKKKM